MKISEAILCALLMLGVLGWIGYCGATGHDILPGGHSEARCPQYEAPNK